MSKYIVYDANDFNIMDSPSGTKAADNFLGWFIIIIAFYIIVIRFLWIKAKKLYKVVKEEMLKRVLLILNNYDLNKTDENREHLLIELGFLRGGGVFHIKNRKRLGYVMILSFLCFWIVSLLIVPFFVSKWKTPWRNLALQIAKDAGIEKEYNDKYSKSICLKRFFAKWLPIIVWFSLYLIGAVILIISMPDSINYLIYIWLAISITAGLITFFIIKKSSIFTDYREMKQAVKTIKKDKAFTKTANQILLAYSGSQLSYDIPQHLFA